jgi:photosystem II stability/assembly factor-like uncharacterized protein
MVINDLGRNFVDDRPKFCSSRVFFFLVFALSFLSASLSLHIHSAASGLTLRPGSTIVDKVERSRLERVVRELSGAYTIYIDNNPVMIKTRYALAKQIDTVRAYLMEEVRQAGYEPVVQPFVLTVTHPQLQATAGSRGLDTIWVAGTNGVVYRSTAAAQWSRFERCGFIEGKVFDLEVDLSGRLWAACGYENSPYGALYLSTDGGSSWTLRASRTNMWTLATMTLKDERTGMASGANGTVITTVNAGQSWRVLDPELIGYESLYRSATNGPMHYWFISDVGSLWETQDLGGTWSRRFPVWTPIAGIDFYGTSCGIIVGDGVVYYTRDGGQVWNPVSIATSLREVSMRDTVRAVASGGGGEIWITEDGGVSWSRFGSECDVNADVLSVAYTGNGWFSLAGRALERRIHWEQSLRECTTYQFADTLWGNNISFRHEGIGAADTLVLLTAHYDSYAGSGAMECAPGADDNASGVSAVLECARALRDERTEKSVEFVLFDAEELGLKGSRYYASNLDPNAVCEGVLNLDMIGYKPSVVMDAVVTIRIGEAADSVIASAVRAAIDSFDLDLAVDLLNTAQSGTSDQMAFWDVGIPGVLLIEGRRGEFTPNYHSCFDLASGLNYKFLEVCTKTALGAIAMLAGLLPAEDIPRELALFQNHPNPFSSETGGSFVLPSPSFVELAVYDVSGRRVAVIERGPRGAGPSRYTWDGRDARGELLASGVYFLRLSSRSGDAVKKIVILR